MKSWLTNDGAEYHYYGIVPTDRLADVRSHFLSEIYNHWDNDQALSPPKQRPPTTTRSLEANSLGLELVAMSQQHPIFPLDVLLRRFPAGSPEQDEVKKMKADFEAEFEPHQPTSATPVTASAGQTRRASGNCDFSLTSPLDFSRYVELNCKPITEAPTDRPLMVLDGRIAFF